MKKLVASFAIVFVMMLTVSCTDSFDEEFATLQTEDVDDTGGGAGGRVDPNEPE